MSSPESSIGRGILRGILLKDARGLQQIQFAPSGIVRGRRCLSLASYQNKTWVCHGFSVDRL